MADKALVAGINNYRSISDLRGCVNDVENIRGLLTDVAGFSTKHVRTLTDGEVTKEQIQRGWDWLLSGAKPGDRLVFHFSGHGSYTTDLDGDESDGVDELLCLHDMDWNRPDSYLLDDELRKFTERVPRGVFLTVILDCCHSGTGTRAAVTGQETRGSSSPQKAPLVDLQTSLARLEASTGTRSAGQEGEQAAQVVERILAPQTASQERAVALARFVEPPPHVVAARRRNGLRSGFRGLGTEGKRAPMNHVLLAGSKPTQTSADAFIGGSYNGAFSYHLCKAIRESGRAVDLQKLIRQVRQSLAQEQFSQVPQLEPASQRGPLFRWSQKPKRAADSPAGSASGEAESSELPEVLQQVKQLLEQLVAGQEAGAGVESRAAGSRSLVYIHGICWHEPGFSRGWWQALREHLATPLANELNDNRREVIWSDLVSSPPNERAATQAILEPREQRLANTLRDALEDRAAHERLAAVPDQDPEGLPAADSHELPRAALGIPGLDCVDDFVKYLLQRQVRREVQRRFLRQVVPLLQRGDAVEVIGHSWGTVVAYETLRRLDARDFPGHVHNLFTVGSALSVMPVQRQLETRDRIRPRHVRQWINLDARGDVVGGSLREGGFGVDLEYLNLAPTGCRSFLGVFAPACAHSSYFQEANVPVNRDIFARLIQAP